MGGRGPSIPPLFVGAHGPQRCPGTGQGSAMIIANEPFGGCQQGLQAQRARRSTCGVPGRTFRTGLSCRLGPPCWSLGSQGPPRTPQGCGGAGRGSRAGQSALRPAASHSPRACDLVCAGARASHAR